jgi:hypothetical protein
VQIGVCTDCDLSEKKAGGTSSEEFPSDARCSRSSPLPYRGGKIFSHAVKRAGFAGSNSDSAIRFVPRLHCFDLLRVAGTRTPSTTKWACA